MQQSLESKVIVHLSNRIAQLELDKAVLSVQVEMLTEAGSGTPESDEDIDGDSFEDTVLS